MEGARSAKKAGEQDIMRLKFRPRASLHLVDDEGVLLDLQVQRIFRLNPPSTLLWCCFAEGWSEDHIRTLVERQCDLSPECAKAYVTSVLTEWRDLGLLDDGLPQGVVPEGGRAASPMRFDPPPREATVPPSSANRRLAYRILDSDIELRGLPAPLTSSMDEALGLLEATSIGSTAVVCTLVETADGYLLTEGNRVVDRCATIDAVVPMVKGALIGMAIDRAMAFAIVHAATVCRNGRSVVLPGPAGSGKSTLAASLVLKGWAVAADDITILGLEPDCPVRSLPSALCLKTDAWPVIAAKAPEVARLTVHRRADGQFVRYFKPRQDGVQASTAPSVPIGLIAFPQYRDKAPLDVRRLDLGEAFDRLLPQFYPASNRFEPETIDRVIGLLRRVTAIELCYGDAAEAIEAIDTWAK